MARNSRSADDEAATLGARILAPRARDAEFARDFAAALAGAYERQRQQLEWMGELLHDAPEAPAPAELPEPPAESASKPAKRRRRGSGPDAMEVLEAVRRAGSEGASRGDVAREVGSDPARVARVLKQLLEQHAIRMSGNRRTARYHVR